MMPDLFLTPEDQAFDVLKCVWDGASDDCKTRFMDYINGNKPSDRELLKQAREILAFVNAKKNGNPFPESRKNLDFIVKRLKDGFSVGDLRAIVAIKWRQVEEGKFERQYFRPATLFNEEKCNQYIGELG